MPMMHISKDGNIMQQTRQQKSCITGCLNMLTLEISLTVIFKVLLSAQFYVHINTQTERCQGKLPRIV